MGAHARQRTANGLFASMLVLAGCAYVSTDEGEPADDVGNENAERSTSNHHADGESADAADDADEEESDDPRFSIANPRVAPFQMFERQPCELLRNTEGPKGKLTPKVEVVAQGLEAPWDIAFLPNGDLLVTERPGRLRLIRNGKVVKAPVLEMDPPHIRVLLGSEGGMLGVLLHPEFATNRLFYLYFLDTNPGNTPVNRLMRYRLSTDGTSAALDRVILDDIPAGGHHQGGRMRIGPDGKLYVGVGAYKPQLAQKAGLPGKLLRMNLDGTVPSDNPTPGSLIYATGIRNTQAYDWYDKDHLLLMDHGPSGIELSNPTLMGFDEFNVVRAGENMGWPKVWGCDKRAGLTEPVMVWRDAMPPAGGAIYTGTAISEWTGSFFVASLGFLPGSGKHLHRIQFDPNNPYVVQRHEVYLKNEYGRLRAVVMGPDGHLYITTSNCENRGVCPPRGDLILRIVGAR